VNISILVLACICGGFSLAACFKSLSKTNGKIKSDFSPLEKKQMLICLANSALLLFFAACFRDVFHISVSPVVVLCSANLMNWLNATSLFNPLFSAIYVESADSSDSQFNKFLNRHRQWIKILRFATPCVLLLLALAVTVTEVVANNFAFHAIWASIAIFICAVTSLAIRKLLSKVEESLRRSEHELKGGSSRSIETGVQLRHIKSQDLKQRLTQTLVSIFIAIVLNIVVLVLSTMIAVGPNEAFSAEGASHTIVPELIAYFTLSGLFPMTIILWSTQFVYKTKVQAISRKSGAGSLEHEPPTPKLNVTERASSDGRRIELKDGTTTSTDAV
jgi:hypothetical protein